MTSSPEVPSVWIPSKSADAKERFESKKPRGLPMKVLGGNMSRNQFPHSLELSERKMKFHKILQFLLWLLAFVFLSYQTYDGTDENLTEFGVPTLQLDYMQLTLSSKILVDISTPKGNVLRGYLGWLPQRSNSSYTSCAGGNSPANTICLKYDKGMELLVTQDNTDQCEENVDCPFGACYRVQWKNHMSGAMDCYNLGDYFWYGGEQTISQRWPIQHESQSWHAAATGDPLHHPSANVQENLWLSSGGFSIYVEHHVPLYLSFNKSGNNKLCMSTSSKHPYFGLRGLNHELAYSICSAMSVKDAKVSATNKWLHKPVKIPEEDIFSFPIWSTWARYKKDINESIVVDFAHRIKEADMPVSQLEIDDKWETCYGELEFDRTTFPNPKRMTSEINELEMPVTLWVHPFCNTDCKCYDIGKEKGFWVKGRDGYPLEIKWWNGDSSVLLDTTNNQATEWFKQKLKRLQNIYGIESFKFDAGEVLWLDKDFILSNEASLQPNIYSREYARIAAEFGGRVEVRVGYETQDLPVFVRMFDKFSHWDYANGLQTLIPAALQLSMQGYNFILPDMIGGNNYTPNNGSLPDRELFIRWLQVNTFLPVMQFSIAPFDYDEEVIKITKKLLGLRENYVGYIHKLAADSISTGDPIILPLWWIAPDDEDAMTTDSQFLLGKKIMVAPILWKGVYQRDIYLPEGNWEDIQRRKTYEGSQWLYSYKAPLSFLPYFIRHS